MEVVNWRELLHPYEQAVEEMKVKFKGLADEYLKLGKYSPIEFVNGRVKKISSILDKANKKNIPLDQIENSIEDIAGIRIICQFVEDIAKVVVLIRERDGTDMKIVQEKDYITKPKSSGYKSYHIIVKYPVHTFSGRKDIFAEIQIRTLAMNFWSTIEHSLKYKYSGNIPSKLIDRLVSCAEAANNLDNEMATIRSEILEAQRVYHIKANLINEIIEKINNLHFIAEISEVTALNKEFVDLYEVGDIEKLYVFNHKLGLISDLYRAHSTI